MKCITEMSIIASLCQAEESVRCLCEAQGLSGACELYRQHMADLLQWLCDSHHTWTSYSIQKTQLEIITVQSGECVFHLQPGMTNIILFRCTQFKN